MFLGLYEHYSNLLLWWQNPSRGADELGDLAALGRPSTPTTLCWDPSRRAATTRILRIPERSYAVGHYLRQSEIIVADC